MLLLFITYKLLLHDNLNVKLLIVLSVMNVFCYAPRDLGASYRGYRNVAEDGRACFNWKGLLEFIFAYHVMITPKKS